MNVRNLLVFVGYLLTIKQLKSDIFLENVTAFSAAQTFM